MFRIENFFKKIDFFLRKWHTTHGMLRKLGFNNFYKIKFSNALIIHSY